MALPPARKSCAHTYLKGEKRKAYTVIKTLIEFLEFRGLVQALESLEVIDEVKGGIFPRILKFCLVIVVPSSDCLVSWILHSFFKVFLIKRCELGIREHIVWLDKIVHGIL